MNKLKVAAGMAAFIERRAALAENRQKNVLWNAADYLPRLAECYRGDAAGSDASSNGDFNHGVRYVIDAVREEIGFRACSPREEYARKAAQGCREAVAAAFHEAEELREKIDSGCELDTDQERDAEWMIPLLSSQKEALVALVLWCAGEGAYLRARKQILHEAGTIAADFVRDLLKVLVLEDYEGAKHI